MINSLYNIFKTWSESGSVYIISDTHFDDADCKYMDPLWIPAQTATDILKKKIHKTDTLIHLGDVGDASYIDQLKCYKILITGNHDILSKVASHFNEVYNGPLFIADRILLSHEPIYGLEKFCINVHGHVHDGVWRTYNEDLDYITHINMASNICNYIPMNLGKMIEYGHLSKIKNYHRTTIDNATARKQKREDNAKCFGEDFANKLNKIMHKPCIEPVETINTYYSKIDIPEACKYCSNHPSNGGNGICNCTLGTPPIIC